MDFKQAKEKKERGVSVVEIINELSEDKDKYRDIVVLTVKPDNSFDVGFSLNNDAEVVGLLEVAKHGILENIYYPQ